MFHQAHLIPILLALGAGPAAPSAPAATASLLTPVSAADYQRAVVDAHKGKVVVVNFWASYCAPCLDEIPMFQRVLAGDAGTALVFVSADPLSTGADAVRVLQKRKLSLRSFIVKDADPEPFINAVDPKWAGQVPFTAIYDRAGKRVLTLDGEQSEAELRAALAKVNGTAP